jgi:hypothetical protein
LVGGASATFEVSDGKLTPAVACAEEQHEPCCGHGRQGPPAQRAIVSARQIVEHESKPWDVLRHERQSLRVDIEQRAEFSSPDPSAVAVVEHDRDDGGQALCLGIREQG